MLFFPVYMMRLQWIFVNNMQMIVAMEGTPQAWFDAEGEATHITIIESINYYQLI